MTTRWSRLPPPSTTPTPIRPEHGSASRSSEESRPPSHHAKEQRMTKKAQQRRKGLLAPRRPKRWRAIESDYGRHVLDSKLGELHPRSRRDVPADDPFVHPNKSQLLRNLQVLLTAALARAGALNSDDDFPDYSALAEEANLTLSEYEAVAMTIDGWEREDIAKFQRVSHDAVRSSYRRGLL